jgi:hypothetical protein
MWMLVLLMVMTGGPRFDAHPKPMSQEECGQAKVAAEQELAKLKERAGDTVTKVVLKCIPWGE